MLPRFYRGGWWGEGLKNVIFLSFEGMEKGKHGDQPQPAAVSILTQTSNGGESPKRTAILSFIYFPRSPICGDESICIFIGKLKERGKLTLGEKSFSSNFRRSGYFSPRLKFAEVALNPIKLISGLGAISPRPALEHSPRLLSFAFRSIEASLKGEVERTKDTWMSRDIQGTVMFKFPTIVSSTFDCSERERNIDMNRNGGWRGDGGGGTTGLIAPNLCMV